MIGLLASTLGGCNFLKGVFLGPSITTKKVPNAVVGLTYDAKIEVSGATFSSVWISAGTLPPGLTFGDDRHIRGTPTGGGSYEFEVFASDTSDQYPKTDSRRFTILVLDITTTNLSDATANRPYGPVKLTTIGAVGTLGWAVTSGMLPDGIVLDAMGELVGSATDGGTFDFVVSATDHDSPPRVKDQQFTLAVQNPAPSISALNPSSELFGGSSFTLEVSGIDFVKSSQVLWEASGRPTIFVDSSRLNAAIPATDISAAGMASISVSNPAPGGGVSNLLPFTISASGASALVRVSVDSAGMQANGPSERPTLSADGRYVTFESSATNLVISDQNDVSDIFVHDTCRNARSECHPSTTRVSLADDNSEANGPSHRPSISTYGRYVAFVSTASNLVAGDSNSVQDIFVRDTCIGVTDACKPTTRRVSAGESSSKSNGASDFPSISATGRYIVFSSEASNLVSGDTNQGEDIFIRDSCIGAVQPCSPSTIRVSVDELEKEFQGPSTITGFSLDARFVTFEVAGAGATPYLRDTCLPAVQRCVPTTKSMSTVSGEISNGERPSISTNGRFVTLVSDGPRLSTTDHMRAGEISVRDTCYGIETACSPSVVTVPPRALQSDVPNDAILDAIVSTSGRYVAFTSRASNLVPEDSNQSADIFVTDTCFGAASCVPVTWRVSRGKDGRESECDSADLAFSPSGDVVAFATASANLASDDTNGVADVFVYFNDRQRPRKEK